MNATFFFRLLFGDDAPAHLVLFTTPGERSHWIPAHDLEEAGRIAEALATTLNVYAGVALQDQAAAFQQYGTTTRGTSATALVLPGFFFDLDIKGPAHKKTALPDWEEAWKLIRQFVLQPTIVIHSGHGLYPWWLFREPWVFKSEKERQQAVHLLRRFQETFKSLAHAQGWNLDTTSDLARVLRIPGTWNRKPGLEPVPVRVLEVNETCRYNSSDFDPYLVEIEPAKDSAPRQWNGPAGALAPVLKHCRFLQHCRDNPVTLSEPEWWVMVSNLARLDGGEEAIHVLSSPYPNYTNSETDAKIRHVLKSPGPHTCSYIQRQLGFTGCPPGGCGVKAPAGLGVSRHAVATAEARQLYTAAVASARALLEKRKRAAEGA
jgi:putative DNA primase/helicase